jgi:hypothetical protein
MVGNAPEFFHRIRKVLERLVHYHHLKLLISSETGDGPLNEFNSRAIRKSNA